MFLSWRVRVSEDVGLARFQDLKVMEEELRLREVPLVKRTV